MTPTARGKEKTDIGKRGTASRVNDHRPPSRPARHSVPVYHATVSSVAPQNARRCAPPARAAPDAQSQQVCRIDARNGLGGIP